MWKKNTWRVGETHSKSWGEWQVRKKVRHQPFQSHSFLKTIATSTPPVLGKPWTTHSLSSTTIAHETTFRLQKKLSLIPQLLIFHYKPTTTLSEDAHPVQVPPPRKLTWRSLEHHHFEKIRYILKFNFSRSSIEVISLFRGLSTVQPRRFLDRVSLRSPPSALCLHPDEDTCNWTWTRWPLQLPSGLVIL